MKQRPELNCSLLSLLGRTCLDQLIDNLPNPPNLFYNSESKHDYIFTMVDDHIQVDELKFKKAIKTNNDNHINYSEFSELFNQHDVSSGYYQLEKGSIIWKIKIEELKKQKINTEKRKGEIIIWEIENLVYDFDKQIIEFQDLLETFIELISKFEKGWNNLNVKLDERNFKIEKLKEQKLEIEKLRNDVINFAKGFIKQLIKNEEFDKDIGEWKKDFDVKVFTRRITEIEGLVKCWNEAEGSISSTETELDRIEKLVKDFIIKIEKLIEKLNKVLSKQKKHNANIVEGKCKIEEIVKNLNKKIINIDEPIEYCINMINKIKLEEEDSCKRMIKIKKSVEDFIEKIEITKVKELEEELDKLAKDIITYKNIIINYENFIKNMGITDVKIKELVKDFIERVNKIEDDDSNQLDNILKDFIKDKEMDKIEEELKKDFIKRIIKIEELEKDHNKWKSNIGKLWKDFTKRINKIQKLAEDPKGPNKFKIFKIDINNNHLLVNEDLIRLFCTDRDRLSEKSDNLNILAGKLLNSNEFVIITNIGIFIFHLNENVRLISLKYFYYVPISKIDDFHELIYGWVSYIKDNKEGFLKYGATLLMFAIEIHNLELIDEIYKKCLNFSNKILRAIRHS